jgi:hypothetical protein
MGTQRNCTKSIWEHQILNKSHLASIFSQMGRIGPSWMHIASPHWCRKISIFICVGHHFWPRLIWQGRELWGHKVQNITFYLGTYYILGTCCKHIGNNKNPTPPTSHKRKEMWASQCMLPHLIGRKIIFSPTYGLCQFWHRLMAKAWTMGTSFGMMKN